MAPFVSREAALRHWDKVQDNGGEVPSEVLYSLRGVVEHSGSLNGGHYVAYVRPRGSKLSAEEDEWYCISDGQVRNISLDQVLRANAYILFYEQC